MFKIICGCKWSGRDWMYEMSISIKKANIYVYYSTIDVQRNSLPSVFCVWKCWECKVGLLSSSLFSSGSNSSQTLKKKDNLLFGHLRLPYGRSVDGVLVSRVGQRRDCGSGRTVCIGFAIAFSTLDMLAYGC